MCLCLCVIPDGKLYDAYISYVNNDYDRKFVNFILKPHLETKYAYKVHLNDNDILPGSGENEGSGDCQHIFSAFSKQTILNHFDIFEICNSLAILEPFQ